METITHLKHCSGEDLENILQCGYIKSGYELGKEKDFGDYTKIFLQIESYNGEHKSLNYSRHCILLNKNILIDRNDYVINTDWKGSVNKTSLKKPKKFTIKFLNLINALYNEVVFDKKISLKKYMFGIKYNVYFDDMKDIRLDFIHKYKLKEYLKLMKDIYNLHDLSELKKRYKKGIKILNLIKKYTNDIRFRYQPRIIF